MKESDKANRRSRDAVKAASRLSDAARLKSGEDPMVLQRENSIFSESFFANARITNLKQAVGR